MNIGFTVKANGMPQYKKKLDMMGRSLEDLEKPMREAGEIAKALVRSYPPYGNWEQGHISFTDFRPGSKYKRTKALQKGWKGQLLKGSKIQVRYRVYNYTTVDKRGRKYAQYVQGDNQAAVHAGWWFTEKEMADKLHKVTLKIFQKFMKDVVKGRV